MLTRDDLHSYQEHCIEHIIGNPYCALFLEMGLGKTVSALTAVHDLMYDYFVVEKVLVIAPLRVAEHTWPNEIKKWRHLKHLKISQVLGTEKERLKALKKPADIYVINRENVAWLVGYCGRNFPFDMVVIDELSSFKSQKAVRFKALRSVRPYIKRVAGLTGTPAPNSLIDLWPQIYLLDKGARLGRTLTEYRKNYFTEGRRNGHVVFEYNIRDSAEEQIYTQISDICISMKREDYLSLPERTDVVIPVHLPDNIQEQYKEFEKKHVLAFAEHEEITAVNAAALTNKLLQFSNGAVYDEDRKVIDIHDEKLDALEEILDTANGKPVLVFYAYRHDLYKIQGKLKKYNPRLLESEKDIDDWNAGNIPLLVAHPKSAGHGLNLQAGGNIIVWYGLTWSLEDYQQANARLHRQGQEEHVIIHHLVSKGTMDEDVMKALTEKADSQNALMEAVKARIGKYKGVA